MNERFLTDPLLPGSLVSVVSVSDKKPEIISALSRLGIRTITPGRLNGINGSEADHADMALCSVGNGRIFAAAQLDEQTVSILTAEGAELEYTAEPVLAERPSLNVCILKDSVILNTKTADPRLMEYLTGCGYRLIHTNQRYAKCSAAVAAPDAVITSDTSVARQCHANGIDVLTISPGSIELEGYSYGFIGGCCGLLSPSLLAFTGRLELHPDHENIRSFLKSRHVDYISLSGEILYDVGGILPIKELL